LEKLISMLIDMTAPMDSLDLRGSRSWRFRDRRQERMGATRREFPRIHDEPALRRKLGLTGTIRARPCRAIISSHIAFAVHRRNNMLTAFVCHTLSI
jgi:hypothetical protein